MSCGLSPQSPRQWSPIAFPTEVLLLLEMREYTRNQLLQELDREIRIGHTTPLLGRMRTQAAAAPPPTPSGEAKGPHPPGGAGTHGEFPWESPPYSNLELALVDQWLNGMGSCCVRDHKGRYFEETQASEASDAS